MMNFGNYGLERMTNVLIKNNTYSNDREYRTPHYFGTFTLGARYRLHGEVIRFIKVTAKGFNFLHEDSNTCILSKHLYAKGYSGIMIPPTVTRFQFYRVPSVIQQAKRIHETNKK